ncbi:hypothetical protein WJX72_008655 [[Myrmecia] bisecta]|uniref:RING-type E3 ubiquitin transferase n=1 Tax=[Myrmecia] bisecta TaxID=41462 RepID=A0AAW1P9Z8_9CHLO
MGRVGAWLPAQTRGNPINSTLIADYRKGYRSQVWELGYEEGSAVRMTQEKLVQLINYLDMAADQTSCVIEQLVLHRDAVMLLYMWESCMRGKEVGRLNLRDFFTEDNAPLPPSWPEELAEGTRVVVRHNGTKTVRARRAPPITLTVSEDSQYSFLARLPGYLMQRGLSGHGVGDYIFNPLAPGRQHFADKEYSSSAIGKRLVLHLKGAGLYGGESNHGFRPDCINQPSSGPLQLDGMKFARYLKNVEQEAPSQWRGKFLRYKQLKKAIKKHAGEVAAALALHTSQPLDDWFFDILDGELKLIDRQFETSARHLIKCFDKGQPLLLCCLPLPSARLKARSPEELAEQAHWCQEYAQINAVGLRKIVKKHDKLYGNKRGQRFLQACWTAANRGRATFLHSPLLTELKALEAMLEPAPPHCADEAFKCPICLDLLYKPLGLTCGHVFCTPCVFGAAGMRNALGTTFAILQHIKRDVGCPECRKTGVFTNAVRLKRAGQLIQKRWPAEVAKRAEEENARLADMRRRLQEQQAAANESFMGFTLPY